MKEILISSSALILLVLLLRWILRGKVRQKLLYAAWLLVALRLLVPVQFGQWQYSMNTLTQTVAKQSETLQQAEQLLQTPVQSFQAPEQMPFSLLLKLLKTASIHPMQMSMASIRL